MFTSSRAKYAAIAARARAVANNNNISNGIGKHVCWNAAIQIIMEAGALTRREAAQFQMQIGNNNESLLDDAEEIIGQAQFNQMQPGRMLIFSRRRSEGFVVSHAMITLGGGMAAGSNNGIIGGAPNFSEMNLGGLAFSQNGAVYINGQEFRVYARSVGVQQQAGCCVVQ